MNCDICGRGHDSKRLPFLCAVDARNHMFEGRLKNVQLLLENESLKKDIDARVEVSTLEELRAQQLISEDRTQRILDAARQLQDEIRAAKAEAERKRATIARRRGALAADSQGLAERRVKQQKDLEKSTNMTRYRWSQEAQSMSEVRKFLCFESAHLYGLRRMPKPGSRKSFEYYLGGLPVVDPLRMNSLAPDVINTSLGHITHVLRLASHYLSIRLPAEIIHPHADHPLPAIYNLANSYRAHDESDPGTPNAADSDGGPKPCPLYIRKPLPQLYKEDTSSFSHFVEGVSLLMYNISWLCCSQGLFAAADRTSFEDICQMGRNLYKLLIHSQLPQNRVLQPPADAKKVKGKGGQEEGRSPKWMGRYSHGTLYYSLNSAEGNEVIRVIGLPLPVSLADKLKRKMVGDAPGPDWEYLEDDAWEMDVPDVPSESIMIENQSRNGNGNGNGNGKEKEKAKANGGSANKQFKGWTKVLNV